MPKKKNVLKWLDRKYLPSTESASSSDKTSKHEQKQHVEEILQENAQGWHES